MAQALQEPLDVWTSKGEEMMKNEKEETQKSGEKINQDPPLGPKSYPLYIYIYISEPGKPLSAW